jgi:enoyl-CoA hydratase/carnithine racemase
MDFSQIIYEKSDNIAQITFNRPTRSNAMTMPMVAQMRDAMEDADRDSSIGAIVVTGAGKSFCAGLDMGVLAQRMAGSNDPEVRPEAYSNPHEQFAYMFELGTPTIAALNGATVAAGFTMALHFDFRIMAESARLSMLFARRGLTPEHGSTWILPRLVGIQSAIDIMLTGRTIEAREALAMGLVNRVVPDGELVAAARELARDLAVQCSPAGLAETKRMAYRHLNTDYRTATRENLDAMLRVFKVGDFKEGFRAYAEKRPPRFR